MRIAKCGSDCDKCEGFLDEGCKGCLIPFERQQETFDHCPFLKCGKNNNVEHCCQCEDFPCNLFDDQDEVINKERFLNFEKLMEPDHETEDMEQEACPINFFDLEDIDRKFLEMIRREKKDCDSDDCEQKDFDWYDFERNYIGSEDCDSKDFGQEDLDSDDLESEELDSDDPESEDFEQEDFESEELDPYDLESEELDSNDTE